MSRPQNATVSAPESPASVRTGTRSNPGAIGAQSSAGLTGKCKVCGLPVRLDEPGQWVHANPLVGISEHMRYAVGQALSRLHESIGGGAS